MYFVLTNSYQSYQMLNTASSWDDLIVSMPASRAVGCGLRLWPGPSKKHH